MPDSSKTVVVESPEELWRIGTRRKFLKLLGIGGSIVLLPSVFAACDDSEDDDNGVGPGNGVTLNLSNETGILNYAYALEQLEAAFYVAVMGSATFNDFDAEGKEVLTDLRNHEVIHREVLRRALGNNAIANLALDQSTVNTALASTESIMKTAEQFEDLGVAAYNGAGKYLTTAANLTLAGKIVSVEARHAAAIRDMREGMGVSGGVLAGTRFAGSDVVTATGLDVKLEPSAVLTRVIATGFLDTDVSIGTQPPAKDDTDDFGPPNPTP